MRFNIDYLVIGNAYVILTRNDKIVVTSTDILSQFLKVLSLPLLRAYLTGTSVRSQGFLDRYELCLKEYLAHLFVDFKQPVCGVASAIV